MRSLIKIASILTASVVAGSAIATPEKISTEIFSTPYVSVFEKLDTGKKESIQVAALCFKTGESTSGMNKICYYDCLGSQAAITISSVQLCPLNINR